LFPLYLYPDADGLGLLEGRTANISDEASTAFARALGMTWVPDGAGDLRGTVGPEDLFFCAYGMVFSPTYRTRYEENLGTDFPHIPLSSNPELVRQVRALSRRLFDLHTLDRAVVSRPRSSFPIAGSNVVEPRHPTYVREGEIDPNTGVESPEGRVYLSRTRTRPDRSGQYIKDVEDSAWSFSVGGFEPASDWLGGRRGETLQDADIEHTQWMLQAMADSAATAGEIDTVIDALGGWPIR